jgi:hypothetical protein
VTTFTVAITGVSPDPEVYLDVARARSYVGAIFGPAAARWLALSPDAQGQTLVAATRYLDEQPWVGSRTGLAGGMPTALAWPRSGVTRGDGTPIDSATVPAEVPRATAELAVLVASDPAVTSRLDQGSNLKSVGGAGVPTVEYFVPTSAAAGTAPRMPVVVLRLVGKYLATSAASIEGGFGQPGGSESAFSRHRQLTLIHGEE